MSYLPFKKQPGKRSVSNKIDFPPPRPLCFLWLQLRAVLHLMIQLKFNHSLPSTLRDGSDPPVFAAEGQAGLGFSCLAAVQGRWRLAKPVSKVPSFVYNTTGLLEHLLSRFFIPWVYQ